MPRQFVRVRLANGTERTVTRVTSDMTVLKDKDATDGRGKPLPAKRKTNVDTAAAAKRPAQSKES